MPLTFAEKDPFAPIQYVYQVSEELYRGQSRFQEIVVFRSPFFGLVLALDGVVQLTERDEFFYHEMLAHVPLHVHPAPRRVLIIGGGDGGTLREVLKHDCVREVTLVELDEQVIATSRKYFPALASGFSDPRLRLVIGEGSAFLGASSDPFDVILVDSTDPVGPAQALFTQGFYEQAASRLGTEGLLACQTESLHFHQEFVREVQGRLARCFPIADVYAVPLATYAGNWWTFSIGSRKHHPARPLRKSQVTTRYYAPDVHESAFLPRTVYERLLRGAGAESRTQETGTRNKERGT